jgi:hypothetical protein
VTPASPDPWAALAARLGPAAVAALARQGFVSAETRTSGATTYKLRWRDGGRQRVAYLGSDPAAAAAVRAGLAALQGPRDARRELARLMARARKELASLKRSLEPAMAARGYRYHGYTARRPRPGRNDPDPASQGGG